MVKDLFTGDRVRLVAGDPDTVGEKLAVWTADTEFSGLWGTDAPNLRNIKRAQEEMRKDMEKVRPEGFPFLVKRLEDDRVIGMVALWDALSPHRNAWVSIGIGERDLWSKGYGSDAMQLILRYGFQELNLHRVNLFTFAINPRAIRSYEKVGFVHEGKIRGGMYRYGTRGDLVFMGILRDEWQAKQTSGV